MKRIALVLIVLLISYAAFATGTSEPDDGPVQIEFKSYTGPIDEELDYSDTAVGQYILERFNLDIEIQPASETTYREELVADFATGSVPDMLTIWVYPNDPNEILVIQKGAREGLLAGLNDGLAEYAPTIAAAVEANNYPIYAQEYMADPTFNGETYMLPTWYQSRIEGQWAFVMRDDIRQDLGIDEPIYMEDTQELIDILRQVKAMNPVDLNGNPAWPMGFIRKWNGLQAAVTRPFDFGGGTGIDIDQNTGMLNHFIMTDFAWEQILFIRQLVEEQLIDPESFTHTFEAGREKIAQARYVVEPFFAGGGRSYHLLTVEANPDWSYQVIGNFHNHRGPDAPILTKNVGMQTHFLHAFGADAPLESLLPFIEFLASPEGNAVANYGVEGVHWDWDGGNAVLRDEFHEDFLNTDVPSPYLPVGVRQPFWFFNEILGKDNPIRNIFGGTNKPRYPLDPTVDDEIQRRKDLAYNFLAEVESVNGIALAGFMNTYERKDDVQQLLSIAYMNDNVMIPAYLAETEEAARALLEDYRTSVERAGLQDYLDYLQEIYDEDPDRYVVYESQAG